MAAGNPLDARHMILIYAGNDPLHTVEALSAPAHSALVVLEDGKPVKPKTR